MIIGLYVWKTTTFNGQGNWQEIDGVIQNSLQDEYTIDESYDNAKLSARNTNKEKTPAWSWFLVQIKGEMSLGEYNYSNVYIGNEKVTRIHMSKYYKHDFELIEPTKYLERFKISGISVTQTDDVKQSLRSVVEKALSDVKRTYRVNFTLDESLDLSQYSPEFTATKKETLFEFLYNHIGKFINAIPRLIVTKDSFGLLELKITYDYFDNIISSTSHNRLPISSENLYQNNDNVSTYIDAEVSNLVVENNNKQASIVYPYKDGWINLRADDIRLTDTSATFDLPYPIKEILKFRIRFDLDDITIKGKIGDEEGKISFYNGSPQVFDITDYVLEENLWKALPVNDAYEKDNNKHNTLYYQKGGTRIENIFTINKEILFSSYVLQKLIGSALIGYNAFAYISGTTTSGEITSISSVEIKGSFESILFNVEYIPYYETTTQQYTPYEDFNKGTLTFNQNSEIVNSSAFGKSMQYELKNQNANIIQKTAREYYPRSKNSYGLGYKVKSEYSNYNGEEYVVTNFVRQFNGNNIDILYTLSKDYIKKSQYISENREYRPYDIPEKTVVDRHIHINEYVGISYSKISTTTAITSKMQQDITDYIIGQSSFKNIQPIRFAIWRSYVNGNESAPMLLSATSTALGNTMQFDFAMVDNFSVGKHLDGKDSNGVPYVRESDYTVNGVVDSCIIRLRSAIIDEEDSNGNYIEDAPFPHTLPYLFDHKDNGNYWGVDINPSNYTDYWCKLNTANDYYGAMFDINKDAGERITGAVQVHFVSLEDDIVIGRAFTENCPLIGNEHKSLRLYLTNQEINATTSKIDLSSGASVDSNFWSFETNEIQFTNTDFLYWAICDTDGNVYLAGKNPNSSDTKNYIYLNFSNEPLTKLHL